MLANSRDPRVRRTRRQVLAVTRELLNEHRGILTFSQVADRAGVARQTLYKHWGTIESLIVDTIVIGRIGTYDDYDGLNIEQRAQLFFGRLVLEVDQGMAAAAAAIISVKGYEQDARDAYERLDRNFYEMFRALVAPVDHDQFIQLVTPILYLVMASSPVNAALLDSLAERTVMLAADGGR
ncbi:MAG: helix-turn-helix domain-containing protein [Actinomycetota bacterium]